MPTFHARVKAVGRRKAVLETRAITLDATPATLRELLAALVRREVEAYNARPAGDPERDAQPSHPLDARDIDERAALGKVAFGEKYHPGRQTLVSALENAITAFDDGLYRVWVGEEEVTALDAPLALPDNSELTFLRLTALTGVW